MQLEPFGPAIIRNRSETGDSDAEWEQDFQQGKCPHPELNFCLVSGERRDLSLIGLQKRQQIRHLLTCQQRYQTIWHRRHV